MLSPATSPGAPRTVASAPPAFAAFLRHPVLPLRATGPAPAFLPGLIGLLLLDIALMAVLVGALYGAEALGFEMPTHMMEGMGLQPGIIAYVVLGAPIVEELAFRGWLSGKPGAVGAALAVLAAALGTAALAPLLAQAALVMAGLALAVVALVVAGILLWRRRGQPPLRFFARHFRWFYALSASAFALVHVINYTPGTNPLLLLPLVVPQLIAGLIFGFARVTYGLWSSIALHICHNALFLGIALAAGQLA